MRLLQLQKRKRFLLFALLALTGCLGVPTIEAQAGKELMVGKRFFDRGQFTKAGAFFESYVASHPDDPAAAFYLGRVAFSTNQYEQAIRWFTKAVDLEEGKSDYHLWLGRAYGRQALLEGMGGQFFLARRVKLHLEKAVELNPDNLAARFDLLEYYLQAPPLLGGGYTEARRQAEAIARRNRVVGRRAWTMCDQAEGEGSGAATLRLY